MKIRSVSILLLCAAFALASCGTGMTPEAKLNRIHFLNTRGKPDEALQFAKEAYTEEQGEARGRILMAGASTAFQLYTKTTQKSYLIEMFSLLNVIINENLPGTPDAYLLASQTHDKLGNFEKAVDFAKRAAKAEPDKKKAGQYYFEVVNLFLSKVDHEQVIEEAEYLIRTYPEYENIPRVEQLKENSEIELAKSRRGEE